MRQIAILAAALATALSLAPPARAGLTLSPPARVGIEENCVQERDPELGISGCTAVIRSGQLLGKELAWAYYNRGVAYNKLGEYRRAIEDYDQALRLDPGDAIAYNNRTIALDYLIRSGETYRQPGSGSIPKGPNSGLDRETVRSAQRMQLRSGLEDPAPVARSEADSCRNREARRTAAGVLAHDFGEGARGTFAPRASPGDRCSLARPFAVGIDAFRRFQRRTRRSARILFRVLFQALCRIGRRGTCRGLIELAGIRGASRDG